MNKILKFMSALLLFLTLSGCSKATSANWNIKTDANNFKIKRRLIALNTRTDEALFTVEGYLSIAVDSDGDLNVTIKTGENDYKLFYAHLSKDVTYTSIQLEPSTENPYQYKITFFPIKEVLEDGLLDITSTE